MARLRLRTQLLIATLLIICTLTGVILLIVRHTVRNEVKLEVQQSVAASVVAFKNVQESRQMQLWRVAAMLAELPTLKALMTTRHVPTIQDGSAPFWRLAGSDIFVLADTDGEVMALHAKAAGLDLTDVKSDLKRSRELEEEAAWWYSGGRLYWVFLRPISSGAGADEKFLGEIAIGYEVDASVAQQLALVAGSKIALATGNHVIASTLPADEEQELQERIRRDAQLSRCRFSGDRPCQGTLSGSFRIPTSRHDPTGAMLRTAATAPPPPFYHAAGYHHRGAGHLGCALCDLTPQLRREHHHAPARKFGGRRTGTRGGRLQLSH